MADGNAVRILKEMSVFMVAQDLMLVIVWVMHVL